MGDAQQAFGGRRDALVRLDADVYAVTLGRAKHRLQCVSHDTPRLIERHPLGPDPLICVDHGSADGRGEADGLLKVRNGNLGAHQRAMRAEPAGFQTVLLQQFQHFERVVVHGKRVEVAGLAEQFTAVVDHRLDVLITKLSRPLQARREALVLTADKLHVHTSMNCHASHLQIPQAILSLWSSGRQRQRTNRRITRRPEPHPPNSVPPASRAAGATIDADLEIGVPRYDLSRSRSCRCQSRRRSSARRSLRGSAGTSYQGSSG